MSQLVNILLVIDKVHTILQSNLEHTPGFGGLNHVYVPNHPTLCLEYMWQASLAPSIPDAQIGISLIS